MGLFGSEEEEKEEVTLGVPEDNEKKETKKNNPSPEVGTIDFGDSSEPKKGSREENSNLRQEVSSLDSVKESQDTSSSGSSSADLEDIRKQNQEIIKKLDKVLSKL